jgi:hypothetical protein
MPAEVFFHRLAAREDRAAIGWYAERSSQVAERFRDAVDRAVARIAANAETLPKLVGDYRWVRANRFPFVLVFRALPPKTS